MKRFLKLLLVLPALTLGACAPSLSSSSRILAPAVGQTWVMRGEVGTTKRTITYKLVGLEPNPHSYGFDSYRAEGGGYIVFYRSAESNVRLYAHNDIDSKAESMCAIYTNSPDNANTFTGKYYEGFVSQYLYAYRNNVNSELGNCTLTPMQTN